MRTHSVVDSPIGPLTLVADDGVLSGLYMQVSRYPLSAEQTGVPDPSGFEDVSRQLREYFAGDRTTFDVRLSMQGTQFQLKVWEALRDIPFGETVSYGELAQQIGQPTGARAVGLANGRNPVSIIVPCHRVIGSTGTLTGYGGGLERKQFLLDLESRVSGKTLI